MIIIKNKQAIDKMRVAGQHLATVMVDAAKLVTVGQSTLAINDAIEQHMRALGLKPECIGYAGYKHATCISVNDVVVHGVPSQELVLQDGDLVKIDIVGSYKGYCADMARSYFVGEPKANARRLVDVAQAALDGAIQRVRPGVHLSDISAYIQQEVEKAGFGVVRRFAGHGIGKSIHEEPEVPNFGTPGHGPVLRAGMTICIEPMITENGVEVDIASDGWTAKTRDGGLAGHVEDTILVTSSGASILTRPALRAGL